MYMCIYIYIYTYSVAILAQGAAVWVRASARMDLGSSELGIPVICPAMVRARVRMEARLETELQVACERLWVSEGSGDAAHEAKLEDAINLAAERHDAFRESEWHNIIGLIVTRHPPLDEGIRVEWLPRRRGRCTASWGCRRRGRTSGPRRARSPALQKKIHIYIYIYIYICI